jgi:hypothetical protein
VCGHLDSDLVRVADEIAERDRPAPLPAAPTTAEAVV